MLHLLVLGLGIIFCVGGFAWSRRPSRRKWELVRSIAKGQGIYKSRHYVRRGKYEQVFTTYALLRSARPDTGWGFVWKMDRLQKGGRMLGWRNGLDMKTQEPHLHEAGFVPSLGVYTVYTGEEDHLEYPQREKHLLELHTRTLSLHKKWRSDQAYAVRRVLLRWRVGIFAFLVAAGVGGFMVPVDVLAPQVAVRTLIGGMAAAIAVGVACMVRLHGATLWVSTSANACLAAGAVAFVALPLLMLGVNGSSFSPLCEGSVPVERVWAAKTQDGKDIFFADVTLPASCAFDAHRTPIGQSLYQEFQAGRRVVDVVVSEGLLGYKRIKLIGA